MATSIQAAEIGKMIVFSQSSGGPSFTNSECTMVVDNPTNVRKTYSCQNSSDGTYAFYVTTGTEFVTPGPYRIQLLYQFGNDLFKGPVNTVQVLANL